MYYLKIANYIDLLTIYSNQIHDLIIVFKSKPDSVIKLAVIMQMLETLSQLIPKIIITTTIVKYQINLHNSSLSQNNASESSINHVKSYKQIINRIRISQVNLLNNL